CPGTARGAGRRRAIRTEARDQDCRVRWILGKADDLSQRPQPGIQIVEVRFVVRGAWRLLLVDSIRRASEAAIVAHKDQWQTGGPRAGQRCNRMLRRR